METPAPPSRGPSPAGAWLGLLWVYSGALWLYLTFQVAGDGHLAATLALAVRTVATITIGVGLCALEPWGWATAVCLTAYYSAVGTAVGAATWWRLATLPPTILSWMPAFLGLPSGPTFRLSLTAWSIAVVSAVGLAVLWHGQGAFDVPYRRAFTVLVRRGLVGALGVILVDAYLAYGWWMQSVR